MYNYILQETFVRNPTFKRLWRCTALDPHGTPDITGHSVKKWTCSAKNSNERQLDPSRVGSDVLAPLPASPWTKGWSPKQPECKYSMRSQDIPTGKPALEMCFDVNSAEGWGKPASFATFVRPFFRHEISVLFGTSHVNIKNIHSKLDKLSCLSYFQETAALNTSRYPFETLV